MFNSSLPAVVPPKKKRKRTKSTIRSDTDDKEGGTKITSRTWVKALKDVNGVQSTWPVPRDKTGYRLNFTGVNLSEGNNGRERTLDAYLRAKVSSCAVSL